MKRGKDRTRLKKVVLTVLGGGMILFFIIPLMFSLFDGTKTGNVALISITGVITGDGGSYLGSSTISSKTIVSFLKDANKKDKIKAVLLEINSGGGGAVASDEIASQVKKMNKPVVALIREVGASGGYWIASASDHIIANRMSITGSIGVISSYLEFSDLMEKYGVNYERLVAGKYKDLGTSLKELKDEEKKILQSKLDTIHDFFIEEISINRQLSEEKVKKLATGEIFLGVEALNYGLIDELGDKNDAENYIKKLTGLKEIDYLTYSVKKGLLESLAGVISENFFKIGEGIGSVFVKTNNKILWV